MTQCTAKAKHTGNQCRAAAITGSTKCRVHGGMTPRGIALPQTKDGRYSKALPVRMQDRFEAAKQDENLLSLREDIALFEARIDDVLKRVDQGESGALWKKLKEASTQLEGAQGSGDAIGMAFALNEIKRLINKGHSDYLAWLDVKSMVKDRAKLASMERKALMEAKQFITITQAMVAMQSLVEAVREHVTDRTALAAIQREFIRIVGIPDRRRLDGPMGGEVEPV